MDTNTTTNNGMQRTQINPIETIIPNAHFFSTFFMRGMRELLPTRFVEWDYFTKGNPKAHFVGEGHTVPPTERGKYKTAMIETPMYQHRKVIGLQDVKERMPGEPYGSMPASMFTTAQERAGRLEAEDDIECVNAVAELREIITCQFLFNGIIDVIGHGVKRKIDYELPNKIRLLSTDRWGQPGVDHWADLRLWCKQLKRFGFKPIGALMSPEIWYKVFENDDKWMAQLDNKRVEKGRFAPEDAAEYGSPEFKGTVRDPFLDLFTQESEYFDDETGEMKRHMPENSLILYTQQATQNRFAYGSVDYMENGNYKTVSGEFIKETWHDDRAGTREVLVTSRAVPIPKNLHSWFVATVM